MQTQITETISQQVMELVSKQVDMPEERISLDSNFETDLGYDSLALVEFTMAIEEQFGISVPDEVASEIKTVRQAIDVIEKALAKRGEQTQGK